MNLKIDKLDYTKIPLVFNIYKPAGPSSFGIVYHFKKNLSFNFGKIGHFGTLDPFAQGVLLIGIQGAQKLNDYIHQLLPKTYRAVGIFGGKTITGDLTTKVTETKHIAIKFQDFRSEELEVLMREHFMGEYWQAPHSVSATKFEGKRLYKHALEGRLILKEKVKREIIDFKITAYNYPELEFEVTVSSGTYVRSLFEEMSALMGGFGALRELERTAIGGNLSVHALKSDEWPKKNEAFNLELWGKPLDSILRLNKVHLDYFQTRKYVQGQRLLLKDVVSSPVSAEDNSRTQELRWIYSEDEVLLGLARLGNNDNDDVPDVQAIFNLQLAIALYS